MDVGGGGEVVFEGGEGSVCRGGEAEGVVERGEGFGGRVGGWDGDWDHGVSIRCLIGLSSKCLGSGLDDGFSLDLVLGGVDRGAP